MKHTEFVREQIARHLAWRSTQDISPQFGRQNGREYAHLIPKNEWAKTLLPQIRASLLTYLREKNIRHHTGTHNLMSSWVLCANLYAVCRTEGVFLELMRQFLSQQLGIDIEQISEVELEFAFEGDLSPNQLLGEEDGIRGSGQTSPDVAFLLNSEGKTGVVLVECKYSEHSFYACSGRKKTHGSGKEVNPNPSRCLSRTLFSNLQQHCHQFKWGRRYWEHLTLADKSRETLQACPASRAGYQLLRQHALAEGVAKSGRYHPVVSAVAFDNRNTGLMRSMRSCGVDDIATQWAPLFVGAARFISWSHQDWVGFVREHGEESTVGWWLAYMTNRYGL